MDFITSFLLSLLIQANITNTKVIVSPRISTNVAFEQCDPIDEPKFIKTKLCINENINRSVSSMAVVMAPSLTATKTAQLIAPDQGPMGPSPGDILEYTIIISNASGAMDATGVIFTDMIDENTTLVAGSLKTSVIAVNDAYSTVGNVSITVPAASGLTANDVNLDGDVLTVTSVNTTGTQGNASFAADGSFTFNPNPGFEGTTTFTYTVSDGTFTSTGTVTVTVAGMIWFIQAGATEPGDGRFGSPFSNITNFNSIAADDQNDNIFLYSGAYSGSLVLLNGQNLIGQGAVGTLASLTGLTFPSFTPAMPTLGMSNPTIANSATSLTAAMNNDVLGVTINNSGGTTMTGSNLGTLRVRNVSLNNTGGIALNLTNGTLDVIFQSISASNGSYGIRLNNTTGSFEITGTGTTDGSGGIFNNIGSRGIELINATNITLRNLTMTNANTIETGFDGICDYDDNILCNAAIYMRDVTTAVLNNVDITTTNEHGINGNNVANLTLTNCTSTGNGDSEEENAVKLINLTGTCSFTGCTFQNGFYRNTHILNNTGTLTLTISNCNFENTNYLITRQDCFEMRTQGTANNSVTITNSSFARAGSKGVQAFAEGSSTFNFNFTGNTIQNFGNLMAGIEVGSNGTGATMNYNINGNSQINALGEVAILASTLGNVVLNGRSNNNSNVTHNASSSSAFSNIRILQEGNNTPTIEMRNNTAISSNLEIPVIALSRIGTNSSAGLNLIMQNNVVTDNSAGVEGIELRVGASATLGTSTNALCGHITNNIVTVPSGNRAFRARIIDPTGAMNLQGGGGSVPLNWANNGNINSAGTIIIGSATAPAVITFGNTCAIPSHPLTSPDVDALAMDNQEFGQDLFSELEENANDSNDKSEKSQEENTLNTPISSEEGEEAAPMAMMMSGETVTVGGMSGFLLPQDRNMTIVFRVSIDDPFPSGICTVSNQGTVSGSNFSNLLTDDPNVVGTNNPTVTTLNIAPTITTCPPNLVVDPTNSSCTSLQSFSATVDGCPAPTVTYAIGMTNITSPYAFPTGLTTVDVTVSNGVLPNATCSFTVNVAPPPAAFDVTGGGTRCDVDPGFVINLSDSETGVNYQLFNGMTTVGSTIAGTGMDINFPAQTDAGIYTVVGIGAGGCSTNMNGSASIIVSETPISEAGMAQSICTTGTATLDATATNGTGVWSVFSGPSLLTSQFSSTTSPTAIFTPDGGAGTYTLRWTVSNNPCVDATDDVVITVNPVPTAEAGDPQTICENGSATLNATFTNGVGIWSVFSGPSTSVTQFADNSDPTTTFTPSGGMGTYTLRWVVTSSGCPDAIDDVIITVNGLPGGNAGMNQAICGNASASLTATSVNGTPAWSVVSGPSLSLAQFDDINSPTATFTPDGGAGTYILRWTVTNAPCSPFTDDVEIIASIPPTGNAGDDQSICSDQTATLNATFANGTGTWNVFSGPSLSAMQFSDINEPDAVFTPSGGVGVYVLRWTVSSPGCTDIMDDVEISVLSSTTAIATPSSQTICSGEMITEIVLSSPIMGTTYSWTRDNVMSVTGISENGNGNISGTLTNTTNAPITVTFTISPSAGTCTGPDITATVLVNPSPVVTCPATINTCLGAPSFVLEGASPMGGVYSGVGVSLGSFDPSVAGVGSHPITYDYQDMNNCENSCTFQIEVATYTTIASGDYYNPVNWEGGCVPPATIPVGVLIVVNHSMTNNNMITNNGTIMSSIPFINQGTYKGRGTFQGDFINNGIVRIAD